MLSVTQELIVEEDRMYIFGVYQNYKFISPPSCERKVCGAMKM